MVTRRGFGLIGLGAVVAGLSGCGGAGDRAEKIRAWLADQPAVERVEKVEVRRRLEALLTAEYFATAVLRASATAAQLEPLVAGWRRQVGSWTTAGLTLDGRVGLHLYGEFDGSRLTAIWQQLVEDRRVTGARVSARHRLGDNWQRGMVEVTGAGFEVYAALIAPGSGVLDHGYNLRLNAPRVGLEVRDAAELARASRAGVAAVLAIAPQITLSGLLQEGASWLEIRRAGDRSEEVARVWQQAGGPATVRLRFP
ncbi:hypothetical protein CGZ93_15550 [Enemella dayhoffiae]|uniref:Lipoprotein n=1 Tax=Enemella dayhoffiae TaxID=2016507 RepID=A0A255GRI9_9ACTN|nr:hypothetical protein [Enemella dayhoffiae]OYO18398.1 hypothetical protein CGZ93_15550 [Enemella dayhoffiae]